MTVVLITAAHDTIQCITLYFISVLTYVLPKDQQLSKDYFCYC